MTSSPFSNRSLVLACAVIGCVVVTSACRVSIETDTGPTVTESHDIEAFSELVVGGAWQVIVEQGETPSLEVEIGEELVDDVEIDQDGNKLAISVDTSGWFSKSGPMIVRLTTPEIEKLDFEGAVEARVEGFESDALKITLEGASELEVVGLSAEDVELQVEGASSIVAEGEIESLDIKAEGASSLDLDDVDIQTVTLRADGASTLNLGKAASLSGTLSGASSLEVSSDADLDVQTAGAASIERE